MLSAFSRSVPKPNARLTIEEFCKVAIAAFGDW